MLVIYPSVPILQVLLTLFIISELNAQHLAVFPKR